ncbi:hypothetical protein BH24DEI2_BH24DEI2_17530 [soil metagenome]
MPRVASDSDTSLLDVSLEPLAKTFKALADVARLKILAHLVTRDAACCTPGKSVCACDLEEVTGLSQPTVSHHMKVLIDADLVKNEKRGRWMYYRVNPRGVELARAALIRFNS